LKMAWLVLIVSAVTDFIINAGTALTAAMLASGVAQIPNRAVILVVVIGGVVSMARTIQQALKATPETSAALKGDVSTVTTSTIAKTP